MILNDENLDCLPMKDLNSNEIFKAGIKKAAYSVSGDERKKFYKIRGYNYLSSFRQKGEIWLFIKAFIMPNPICSIIFSEIIYYSYN